MSSLLLWSDLRSKALEINGCDGTDEDVLTYSMFPQVAPKFFGTRKNGPTNPTKEPEPAKPTAAPAAKAAAPAAPAQGITTTVNYNITFNGQSHKVTVTPVAEK